MKSALAPKYGTLDLQISKKPLASRALIALKIILGKRKEFALTEPVRGKKGLLIDVVSL